MIYRTSEDKQSLPNVSKLEHPVRGEDSLSKESCSLSLTLEGLKSKHSDIGVIAIDGAAGTGKGTLARNLSQIFNVPVLDTGAIYRTLAYILIENEVALSDTKKLNQVLKKILPTFQYNFEYRSENGQARVYYNNKEITDQIRSGPISMMASYCSTFEDVRKALRPIQRAIALKNDRGMIVEGRDIGTRVFPEAPIKIFIDGEPIIRAQWRYRQLLEKFTSNAQENQNEPQLYEVIADFLTRDLQDRTRELDPLPFEAPPGYFSIQVTRDNPSENGPSNLSELEVALIAFNFIEQSLDKATEGR